MGRELGVFRGSCRRARLSGLTRGGTIGEEVLEAQAEGLEVGDDLLHGGRQQEVTDHAEQRDRETERGVVHRLGDAFGEHLLAIRRRRVADAAERLDEAGDGAEQTDERRDVRERPQRTDARLHFGDRVGHRLFHRLGDGRFTAVEPIEAGLGDARDRRAGRVAQLLGAVDVVRRQQLAQLLEERLRVQVPATQEVNCTLDDDRENDRQEERVDDEEGPALLEDIT